MLQRKANSYLLNPAVIVCPEIKSPALFGFLRPKLLLPAGLAGSLKRDELRCIVLHELAHLKRADIAVYWLTGLLQVLHWFNPLVWYGFYRMRQDGEVACDALVLFRFRPAERTSYGHTMIKLAAAGGGSRPVLLPRLAGIVEEESQIKRRITMISRFNPPPLALIVAGGGILAVLCVIFLTSAKPGPEISYGLDSPGAFVVYAAEKSAEIGRDEEGYEALLEAVEETMRETGLFEADHALKFPAAGIGEYLVQAGYAAGLEVIYDQPVELSFIGEKNVYRLCLFIDAHKGLLFISTVKEGSYRDGGYSLVGSEALRQICEDLERELFPAPPWHGIDNPERITVKSGDYIADLHRGEEGYDAILRSFFDALPETGPLDPLDTLHFGNNLTEYLDNKGTTAWLEFYYDEPAEFALIGREVNHLLLDLDEAALFWGRSDALYYRRAPYFLSPGEALRGAVTAYFDALLARGVTGYVTGVEEGRILVVASAPPWLAGKPGACWFEIPPGMSPLPALGDKVTVSFDRIINMSYHTWVAVAAGVTVLEPQAHPGARLTETEAIAAALPLPEERYYLAHPIVWALKEIVFDGGTGQWLLTFGGWDIEMESHVAVDDATGAVTRLRPAFIISEDLFVNGVDYFITGRGPDLVPGESLEKILQTFGEPLDRQPRQNQLSHTNPDYMVYWDTWHYQGISFKLLVSRHKDDPEPGDPEYLRQIYITGNKSETFRDIRVGDTIEKVFEKYGPAEIHDGRVSYGGGWLPFINFVIENGKVAGIILSIGEIPGEQSF